MHQNKDKKSLRDWQVSWRTLTMCLLLSHLAFASILYLAGSGRLQTLELLVYDHALHWQRLAASDERIVLIGETETDIQRWGYPLPDGILTDVLKRIIAGRPRVIGVDKYRDLPVPPGSEQLNQILLNHPEIVWVMKFGHATARESAIAPPPVLTNSERIGFSDIPLDEDGLVRRGLLFLDDGQQFATAFPLVVALRYLQAEGIQPQPDPDNPDWLRLGKTTIPPLTTDEGGYAHADTAGYQYLLDYRGQLSATRIHTLTEVLKGQIPATQFTDKIVLLGGMATSLRDEFQVPAYRFPADAPSSLTHVGDSSGRIAGVVLQALQVNQLLRFALTGATPIQGWSDLVEIGWLWVWCLTGFGLALCRLRLRWLLALITSGLTLLAGIWLLVWFQHIWLPLAGPALGLTLAAILSGVYRSAQDQAEKRTLMSLFSSHVAPEVVEALWRERDRLVTSGRLIPQRLTATVLFADIQGFTGIAETLESTRLMEWLNVYMEAMTQVVMTHDGVIKQYIGDQVMALFGAPVPRQTETEIANDATQAVACALDMDKRLRQLNVDWARQGLPVIAMRVGIHTGPLIAGSLGSRQRIEYAVIGDTVNIASRLESFEKDTHHVVGSVCRILIGETTLRYLHHTASSVYHALVGQTHFHDIDHRFRIVEVGATRLKGKQQGITVYQVDGIAPTETPTPDYASVANARRPDSTPRG
jgi:adenylate cyclase